MKELLTLQIPGGTNLKPINGMPDGKGINSLENIIQWGTTMIIIIAVFTAIFIMIWGGIQWTASGGNKSSVESARKKIMYAVIGLVVIFSSFLIINIVGFVFGVNFF